MNCVLYFCVDWIEVIAFSPDGQTLATASRDKSIRFISLKERAVVELMEGIHEGMTKPEQRK